MAITTQGLQRKPVLAAGPEVPDGGQRRLRYYPLTRTSVLRLAVDVLNFWRQVDVTVGK